MHKLNIALLLVCFGCTAQVKEELNAVEDQLEGLTAELAQCHTQSDRLRVEKADLERDIANFLMADAAGLDATVELWARIDTTMGVLLCKLEPALAPGTVSNFVQLAEGTKLWTDPATGISGTRRLYPGTIFHRVLPEFMIQAGDPVGDGTGSIGYTLDDEFHPGLKHVAGALSMARGTAGTSGSQFFITEVATPHLDTVHNVFGKCEPLALIKDIARVPKRPAEKAGEEPVRPVVDVVIETITIHRGSKPR
jgi:peptidyl-prolyl cis-trans isomerase A (cyclophilin A)